MTSSIQIQSSLKELEHVLDRLMSLNFYYQQFIVSPEAGLLFFAVPSNIGIGADKTELVIDIIFESMILSLYKFYELQPVLARYLHQKGHTKLLEGLREPWREIEKERRMINLWRNRIVAHSGEQSTNYMFYTKIDPTYNKTRIAVVTLCRYVVLYVWAILGNIQKEFKKASDELAKERSQVEGLDGIDILEMAAESEIGFSQVVNRNLRERRLKPVNFRGYNEWPMSLIVRNVARKAKKQKT